MMEKALNSLFGVVSAEAERNQAFAGELQEVIIKLASQFDKNNLIEKRVKAFNPFAVFKASGRDGMTKELSKETADVLRIMVKLHNADPAGQMGVRPKKADLVEAMVSMAERRAKRDAKLFDY